MVIATRPNPHDLVWIENSQRLQRVHGLPVWVNQVWSTALPLVVRRDYCLQSALLPVGIRGLRRSQRAAAWVSLDDIDRVLTPEQIRFHFLAQQDEAILSAPLRALKLLSRTPWPWRWGVTGSCGYQLATGSEVLHADSDLDLVVYAPLRLYPEQFVPLLALLPQLPCRVDIQMETQQGACSLLEWVRNSTRTGHNLLLKTDRGPLMVSDLWSSDEEGVCN